MIKENHMYLFEDQNCMVEIVIVVKQDRILVNEIEIVKVI